MSEATMMPAENAAPKRKLQYRGRGGQVLIYLTKFLRMFIYQADWKVLPMAALIAGLVSMVVRRDFFLTMEGSLKGALALTCLSIWNGCFNSIQVVCREREIIKREHRSGLHISAYIFSHMLYQALLCLMQTALTVYVCKVCGIQFPAKGLFTPWGMVDIGITIFLITYASDMLSLWISCMTRSTTTAMTIMPFVLIFQLVFSGGIFTLPSWARHLSAFSISNYGLKCIAAQSNYNDLPLVTAWNSLVKVENQEINTTITLGQVMDFLSDDTNPLAHDLREHKFRVMSPEEALNLLGLVTGNGGETTALPSLSQLLETIKPNADGSAKDGSGNEEKVVTVGQVIDTLAGTKYIQDQRDESYTFSSTMGEILNAIGRERAETYVKDLTARANYTPDYEYSKDNIIGYWCDIFNFVVICSILAVVFLEFVDKDKR